MLLAMRAGAMRHVLALGAGAAVLALAAASLMSAPACSAPQGPAPKAPDPVKIGASLSLTNGLAGSAEPLKNAIKAAEGQINANGGLLGRPVQFVILDDQSDETAMDPSTIRTVATNLVAQNVVAFLGPVGSSQVLAMQDITYNKQIIQIVSNATSPDLVAAQPVHDRYLFRTTPADDLQARALVKFAMEGPNGITGDAGSTVACKNMPIFHINNAYGNAMTKVIQQYFPTKVPGVVLKDIAVDVDVTGNYSAQVAMIAAAKPDCMAIITYEPNGDQFMTDYLKYKMANPTAFPSSFFIIGTDGIYTDQFLDNGRANKADKNSPTVAEGVYGTNPDTNPPTSQYGDFRTIYQAYFQEEPPAFTANMYDAAMLVALAIEQAGTLTDHVAIRDALYDVSKDGKVYGPGDLGEALQAIRGGVNINYEGASGSVDIDDNGNVISNYIVWKVTNGQFTTLGRIDAQSL
jgi:branched-chain amino acid transport system substrate-binding protein/neutral amino acid transport system substrate-binding protein